MKIFKRYFCFVIILILTVLTLPNSAVSANTDVRYGKTILNQMENSDLLLKIYDTLVSECADVQKSIKIKFKPNALNEKELQTAYSMFYSDYPEYYWLENGSGFSISSDGTIIVEPILKMTKAEVDKTKSTFNSKLNSLLKGLDGKSDYEKSKILHDRLCNTVNYTPATYDQTAYGALVEGKAVCNGYARAYQLLMQKAGISSWYLHGISTNPTAATNQSTSHAWNMVMLDDSWYFTDVTWNDQSTDIFYTYFNVTSAQINSDHELSDTIKEFVPNATSTDANYYIKEDKVFAEFDLERITNLLKENNNKVQIYISKNTDEFFSDFKDNINSIASSLDITSGGFSIAKLGKGAILAIGDSEEFVPNSSESNTITDNNPSDYEDQTETDNPSKESSDYTIYIIIGAAVLVVIIIIFIIIVKIR